MRLHPLHHRYRDGRPVYAHLLKEYDRLKERFPFVHFNTPVSRGERLDADLPASELTLVAGLLHHAQVMVQHYSTIAVEGCLHDLPTINLGFEPGARLGKGGAPPISDWAARRSHNRRVVETGGVPVARDETELLALIRGYRADPRRDAAGRARVRANEGGAHPGRAGRAVGERLLELAPGPTRPSGPETGGAAPAKENAMAPAIPGVKLTPAAQAGPPPGGYRWAHLYWGAPVPRWTWAP